MYKKESPLGWAQPSAGNRGAGAGTDTRCFLLIASVSRLSARVSCNISEGLSGIGDGEFSPPLSDFGPRDSGRSGLHLLSTEENDSSSGLGWWLREHSRTWRGVGTSTGAPPDGASEDPGL